MILKSYAFACKADVLMDILTDAGVSTGLRIKGECSKLSIKPDSERKEMIGRGRETDGQVVGSIVRPKPTLCSFTFLRVDADLLAMGMAGVTTSLNQPGGTVENQVVIAKLGKYVELFKINLSATGLAVKNEAGDKTFDQGVDYDINYRLGLLIALQDGEITDGQTLKVTYTHVATTGQEIVGGKRYSIRSRILMDGQNIEDGTNFSLDVPRVRLATDTEIDFLKDGFLDISMSGVVEMAPGQTYPYKMVIID